MVTGYRQTRFAANVFRCCYPVLYHHQVVFGLAPRQAHGIFENLLRLAGLEWGGSNVSMLSRCYVRGSEPWVHILVRRDHALTA